jgi:hypothetical protein
MPPRRAVPGAETTRLPAVSVDTTRLTSPSFETTRMASPVAGGADADATRMTTAADLSKRLESVSDEDTHIPHRKDDDETMAPHSLKLAKAALPDEAQLVANGDLVIETASATGQLIFGVRPETLVGESLTAAVERSIRVLSTTKGRPTLALFATRNETDKTIKMTFKAGQAVEPVK